ncbi:hypothetical protein DL96DRAFT_1767440 [Flagelloscypha sp. PMI_526]|nr:hypothetical protein DL96DRAFT_1767440 [Flagelloscypha sp. PMI_526]
MSSGASTSSKDTAPSLVQRTTKKRSGALSCAECRRLKLKCSRVFPCSNCQKKGCAAICPEASLTTGKGNRFVLADTEDLHDKIHELSARIRTLEDALALSHALHSNQPHPLLSETLRQIKRPLEREIPKSSVPSGEVNNTTEEATTAMGSLTIHDAGRSTFHSTFASSWHLLTNEDGEPDEHKQSPQTPSIINLPTCLPWLSSSFPFSPAQYESEMDSIRGEILKHLPPPNIARTHAQSYFSNASFMFTPVQEPDFWERVYRPIYEHSSCNETISAHMLALLFIVVGFGAHMDLESRPDALTYYHLSRASLSLESVLERPSLEAIQALVAIAHFMFFSDVDEPRWMIMGIVVKMLSRWVCTGILQGGTWMKLKLEDGGQYSGRSLSMIISSQSFSFGRPPSFPKLHADTKYPFPLETKSNGEVEMSFPAWKVPTYKTARELGRQVSEFYAPQMLPGLESGKLRSQNSGRFLMLERFVAFCIREMTFFYLHRGWFAQALEESPDGILESKYSHSVLAAYNTACKYVGFVESTYKQEPILLERMWFVFSHVFSCCIILGTIAAKPKLPIAKSALFYLEVGYSLFLEVSSSPKRAKVLPTLQKLRDRAHAVQSSVTSMYPEQADAVENATRLSFVGPKVKQKDERVTILHDQPVLGSQRQKSQPPSSSSASPESIQMSDSVSSSSSQSRGQPFSQNPSIQPASWVQAGSTESSRGSSTHLHVSHQPTQLSRSPSSATSQYDPFADVTLYHSIPPPHPQQSYEMSYQDYSMHPCTNSDATLKLIIPQRLSTG